MKIKVLLLLLFIALSSCDNNKTSFVFIGDVHYKIPEYLSSKYLVPSVAGEIRNLKVNPDFILLTGDFSHGRKDSLVKSEAWFAFNNFSENMDLPFFIAKGNHDPVDHFTAYALPRYTEELERKIEKTFFSFDHKNCHFIILDCTLDDLSEQLVWLEEDLRKATRNPSTDHIFAAGHYPLWIVARAGFTRPAYAIPVAALLAEYKADAYFCGHTHNKTMTVRRINDQPLTQIMDAAVVEEGRLFNLAPFLKNIMPEPKDPFSPGVLPLEEAHQIFIPRDELDYYWGYQEGSTTSYWIINVKGQEVTAEWHVTGKGVVRSVKWNEPGKIQTILEPEFSKNEPVSEEDLRKIDKVWLYAAPWTDEDTVQAHFSINGFDAGVFTITKKGMAASPFWNKIEIKLNDNISGKINMQNEILISNPDGKRFGIAHLFLLVQFKDGRFAKTSVSQKVITSFKTGQGSYANFPSEELIEAVDLGDVLAKTVLEFNQIYSN